jgi:L-ribulose-5-phosphate 4-epimerase
MSSWKPLVKHDPLHCPGIVVASHGPFSWGKDAKDAVMHAVVMEEVAMMAWHAMMMNPSLVKADQVLLDKHFFRKHGPNAYYGQK